MEGRSTRKFTSHLVDVDCVGFLPLALPFLLVPLRDSFGGLARNLERHCKVLKSASAEK